MTGPTIGWSCGCRGRRKELLSQRKLFNFLADDVGEKLKNSFWSAARRRREPDGGGSRGRRSDRRVFPTFLPHAGGRSRRQTSGRGEKIPFERRGHKGNFGRKVLIPFGRRWHEAAFGLKGMVPSGRGKPAASLWTGGICPLKESAAGRTLNRAYEPL